MKRPPTQKRGDRVNLCLAAQIPKLVRREAEALAVSPTGSVSSRNTSSAAPSRLVRLTFVNLLSLGGKRDWPHTPVLGHAPAVETDMQIPGWRQQDMLSARAESLLGYRHCFIPALFDF